MGDLVIEFFPKLLDFWSELIADYREIPWLRDIRPIKKIKEEFKVPTNAEKERVEEEKQDQSNIPPDEGNTVGTLVRSSVKGKVSESKTLVPKISERLDAYLTGRNVRAKANLGKTSLSLFENTELRGKILVKSLPFLTLGLPSASASLEKTGDRTNFEMLGVTMTTTKSVSFFSQFLLVKPPSESI